MSKESATMSTVPRTALGLLRWAARRKETRPIERLQRPVVVPARLRRRGGDRDHLRRHHVRARVAALREPRPRSGCGRRGGGGGKRRRGRANCLIQGDEREWKREDEA